MFDRSLEGNTKSAHPSVLRFVDECVFTGAGTGIRKLSVIIHLGDSQPNGRVNQRRADHMAESRARREKPVGFERLLNAKTRRREIGIGLGEALAVAHPKRLVIQFTTE